MLKTESDILPDFADGGERSTETLSVSIGTILEAAPWKHALFTTYTLSLSYFESEVLRPLIRSGCNDIWLIADAEGYRASLLERRSARVGQEYRLIPAALPHGILHAKCIYLASDNEDLLLVGSGNLTFGGHGRNAEVFEALRPEGASNAFEEFALFLESIGSRPDIKLARSEWVEDFAGRARSAARRGHDLPDGREVRLVHSLDTPVVGQLPDLLAPYGSCAQAIVMSPYYDPDGSAVAQLLDAVKSPNGVVAVTAKGDDSPFPFAAASTWKRPVAPLRLREPEKRFVHAKWYEFALKDRRLLLTGSINATRKALTTTDNIELGVLRPLDQTSSPLGWVSTATPAFKAQKPMPSGLGSHELVYASFDRSEPDWLRGHLISLQPVAGLWQMRLVQADGDSFAHDVQIDDTGHFSLREKALEHFSQVPALQIVLTIGERQARGWVHNDMLLGMKGRRRLTAGALSRLMRRDASDDDIQALLDYLSIHAEQHLRLFNQPIVARESKDPVEEGGERIVTVSIGDLTPLDRIESGPLTPTGGGPVADDQFHSIMAQLRRVLLGHGRAHRKAMNNSGETGLAEEDPDSQKDRTPEQLAYSLGLSDFERTIDGMIDGAADLPEVRNGLLVTLLEVSMAMRLHRLDDKDGAHEFLNAWFFRACSLGRASLDKQTALQQHVITAGATLFLLARHADTGISLATELHAALESFYQGIVEREHAFTALIADPQIGFAASLMGEVGELDLQSALEEVLATRTRRQQLEDAISLAERGLSVPANWDVFLDPLGRRLWQKLQGPNPQKRVKRAPPEYRACAFDWFKFAPQELGQFERTRIGFCIHCEKFTVNTQP